MEIPCLLKTMPLGNSYNRYVTIWALHVLETFCHIRATIGDTLSPQNNASRKWLQQICYSLGIICPGNILSHQRSLMEIPCLLKTMPLGNGQNKKQTQLPGVFPLPGLFVWYFKNVVTASLSLVQEHIWVDEKIHKYMPVV